MNHSRLFNFSRSMLSLLLSITCVASRVHGDPDPFPAGDHLIPFPKQEAEAADYQRLWQRKLLVTSGDVARLVHLQGVVGTESAVSVYRRQIEKGGLPGGYWVTVTQASGRLWDCIGGAGVEHPVDPRTIAIKRCDLPLPESTAVAVRNVWLAMLLRTRPEGEPPIVLDSSTEIYSARGPNGKVIVAQAPYRTIKDGTTQALLNIANLLIEFCDTSSSERSEKGRQIEREATKLLRRVAR